MLDRQFVPGRGVSQTGSAGGPDPSVPYWGRTYEGRGDPDVAVEAVSQVCREAGLVEEERRVLPGVVEMRYRQTAPRREIWRDQLLQDVRWQVEGGEEGALRISVDFRMFPFYRRRLLLLSAPVAPAFLGSLVLQRLVQPQGWLLLLDFLLVPVLVLAVALIPRWNVTGSGSRANGLCRRVVSATEAAEGRIEPRGMEANRRYVLSMLVFFTYVVGSCLVWLGGHLTLARFEVQRVEVEVLMMGGALLLFSLLGVALFVMVRQEGFGERVNAIGTGFATSLSALFLVATPQPFRLYWERMRGATVTEIHLLLTAEGVPAEAIHGLRYMAVVVLLAGPFFVAGALLFLPFLGKTAVALRGSLLWERRHPIWSLSRSTRGDPLLVRRFRWIFLSGWVVLGSMILALAGFLLGTMVEAAIPRFDLVGADLPIATLMVLMLTAGVDPSPGWSVLVHLAWIAFGLLVLSLFLLSLGQLARARRRQRRRLEAGVPDLETRAGRTLVELCRQLGRAARLPGVRPAVRSGHPDIGAWACSFGFFRPLRFVEVSSGALEKLDREELAALVAHEVAHHRHRRPQQFLLLRWLGRLTFVGDGFSSAVQHSFGYEQEADRTALELLDGAGLDRGALRRVLRRIRHVNGLVTHDDPTGDGLPAVVEEAPDDRGVRDGQSRPSWREGWQAVVEQYCSGMELHYWHPVIEERLAALPVPAPPPLFGELHWGL